MEDYMYGHQAQANYGYVPTPTAPMDMSLSYPHPSHPYTSYQDQQPDLTRLLASLSHPSQQQSMSSMMGMPNPAISALLTSLMSQPQSTSSFTPTSTTTTPSRPTPSNIPTNGMPNGIPPPMKPVPSSSVPLPPTNGHLPTTIPKRRPKRGRSSTLTQEERLKSRRLKHRQLDADRRSRLAAGFDTLQELTANVTGLQTTKFSTSSQNGSQNGADSDSEWDDEEDGSGSDSKQGEKKKKKKSNPQANAATMKTDKASILILSSQVLYNLQQEVASLREQVERERRAAQADGDDDIDEVEVDTSTINNNQQQQDHDYVQLPNLQCSMFLNAGMSMTCYDMDGRLVDCNQTFLNIHGWPSRDAVLGLPLMSAFFHDVLSNHVHNRHPHLMKHYINQPSTNPFYQKTITYSSPIVAARFAQAPTQEEINKLGPPTAYYPSTALDYRRLFNGEEQVITTTDRLYDGEGHLYEEKCTSWLVYEQDRPMYLVGYAQKDTCLRLT